MHVCECVLPLPPLPPLPSLLLPVKYLWEKRDSLGLASSVTLRDLGLSVGAGLCVSAGERVK